MLQGEETVAPLKRDAKREFPTLLEAVGTAFAKRGRVIPQMGEAGMNF